METDISLSLVNNYNDVSFADVEDAFREASVTSALNLRRPEGPFAFLEWLIPAGLMLIYSRKFLEKLAEKHAERADQALAGAFSKLWSKAFGPKPPIDWKIVNAEGHVKGAPFSAAIKTSAELCDGRKILLVYHTDMSAEDFTRANLAFLAEMAAHRQCTGDDRLTRSLARIPPEMVPPPYTAMVYFNPATANLEVIDYVASSMQQRLVSYPL